MFPANRAAADVASVIAVSVKTVTNSDNVWGSGFSKVMLRVPPKNNSGKIGIANSPARRCPLKTATTVATKKTTDNKNVSLCSILDFPFGRFGLYLKRPILSDKILITVLMINVLPTSRACLKRKSK